VDSATDDIRAGGRDVQRVRAAPAGEPAAQALLARCDAP
jgi:hypothetical protein